MLVITGPPGVGESAVLAMLSDALVHDDLPHAFVEVEQLAAGHPEPSHEERMRPPRAICERYRAEGHELLRLTDLVECGADLARLPRPPER